MMGNNNRGCDKQEELVTYLYGESTPEAAKRFEAHIHECLTCARELREFSSLRDTLQSWEVDTLPHVVIEPKRTFGMILRELFTVTPVWAKGFAAVAVLLLFAALLNVEVTIGNFKIGAHLFAKNQPTVNQPPVQSPSMPSMDDVSKLIDQKVSDSRRKNNEEMQAKLVELRQDIFDSQQREMNLISANLRQGQQKIIKQIVNDTIARNDLKLGDLFNNLDSDTANPDKNQNK